MNYFPIEKKPKKQKFLAMVIPDNIQLSNIYGFGKTEPASAVVFRNEIHILGGGASTTSNTYHYKWDSAADEWTSISTLPFQFRVQSSCAVVFNDEIHIFGGVDNSNAHWAWDGETWTNLGILPFNIYFSLAVVDESYNRIHIIGGLNSGQHYSWVNGIWREFSPLPVSDGYSRAAVYLDQKIYVMSGTKYYYYNDATWTEAGNLPANITMRYKCATVLNGRIHIFVSDNSNPDVYYLSKRNAWTRRYYFGNTSSFYISCCNVTFHGIHTFVGNSNGYTTHYFNFRNNYIPIDE